MNRKRIDEVRLLLVESFIADDMKAYAAYIYELETLIGVEHGDRDPLIKLIPIAAAWKADTRGRIA